MAKPFFGDMAFLPLPSKPHYESHPSVCLSVFCHISKCYSKENQHWCERSPGQLVFFIFGSEG